MKEIFLVAVFLINGQAGIDLNGFGPRVQPSMEVCQERKELLQDQLVEIFDNQRTWVLICDDKDSILEYIEKYNSSTPT